MCGPKGAWFVAQEALSVWPKGRLVCGPRGAWFVAQEALSVWPKRRSVCGTRGAWYVAQGALSVWHTGRIWHTSMYGCTEHAQASLAKPLVILGMTGAAHFVMTGTGTA